MSTFLIVGKPFSSLKEKIESSGDSWILVRDSQKNTGYSSKKANTFYCDLSSLESTNEGMKAFKDQVDGILNIYENYILASSWLGEILDLPVINRDAAVAATNKYIMRTKFSEAAEKISPDFEWADTWQQVEKFAQDHSFPLIIKPTGLSKSLLVTKSHNMDELRQNFEEAIRLGPEVYKKYSPHQEPRFIVEEFMEGPIFSVDGYADSQGHIHMLDVVVDYESGYDIGMDDSFHYSRIIPSRLSNEDQQEIRRIATLGMKSLGMTSSPAHCELILTSEGPRLVEIGARNGGYRDKMHGLANDIDIYGAMMDLALDKPLQIERKRNDNCAVLELFPITQGKFTGISNLEKLESLASLNNLRILAKEGEVIGKASEGYKMACRVILFSEDTDTFNNDLEFIKDSVSIEVT